MPLFKPSWSAVRFGKDAAIFCIAGNRAAHCAHQCRAHRAAHIAQHRQNAEHRRTALRVRGGGQRERARHMRLTEKPHSAHESRESHGFSKQSRTKIAQNTQCGAEYHRASLNGFSPHTP